MTEAVRLVIWDLDDTFWKGTLAEEGIDSNHHYGAIVRELNKRGIMNSICSKNDFSKAKTELEKLGIWDQFIFPSIDWTPKGARVENIINKVKLRPESIMFIDDNPLNREEIKSLLPKVQVKDENFIPNILQSEAFIGKEDSNLKRLANYKLMETKDQAAVESQGDNSDFLRNSNISVELDYNINDNIDRLIEIINRTNQLNFTKNRLSDDINVARAEAKALLEGGLFETLAFVRVRDRFGDYGIVGFFHQIHHSTENKLKNFCFSCRVLGMHIETWLYNQLGRPELNIVGEVANNPLTDNSVIDWISWYENSPENSTLVSNGEFEKRPPIVISGGCESESLQHYIGHSTNDFRLFSGTVRDNFIIRRDHSSMVRIAAENDQPAQEKLIQVGYKNEDFELSFDHLKDALIILSFWADIPFKIHALSGLSASAPYIPPGVGYGNFQEIFEDDYYARGGKEEFVSEFRFAKANLKYKGHIDCVEFKENLNRILSKIDPSNKVIFLLPALNVPDPHPEWGYLDRARLIYACQIEVSYHWPNVECVKFDDFLASPSEATNYDHFLRIVYQRCGLHLRDVYMKHIAQLKNMR
ncbi:HAD-IIIC family phosphatase [Oecophyllibacter saccharovorans]|uniref:HAD-IIIC family phosphatase n=1 Tax=Oecophyllibacter saccharovorans TaxID=2558360 RepID=UPI001143B1EE|nr:HAD-IIIC family phosphatase [Oecophyllibacter saccharovorans]QDH14938.1 HAD-IIIC family phosphatase [Oecophyllibacter saccharovorans]